MSQTTAFLILVVALPVFGPVIYALIGGVIFSPSPAWWASWLAPALIAAAVLGVIAIPVCRKFGAPWAAAFGAGIIAAGMVSAFLLYSLPMMLTFANPQPTSYLVTVADKKRSGKQTCDYPFSIAELWQSFCAETAADYEGLRKGQKLEVIGRGNASGMFIEGYRLAE